MHARVRACVRARAREVRGARCRRLLISGPHAQLPASGGRRRAATEGDRRGSSRPTHGCARAPAGNRDAHVDRTLPLCTSGPQPARAVLRRGEGSTPPHPSQCRLYRSPRSYTPPLLLSYTPRVVYKQKNRSFVVR